MKLSLKEYLLPLGLLIALVISLLFSYLIWINPARPQTNSGSNTPSSNNTVADGISKKIGDIYLPTNLVFNTQVKQYRLTSATVDLTNYAKKQLVKWDYGQIKKMGPKSAEDYQAYLQMKNALVLNYPAQVTVATVGSAFNFKVTAYNSGMVSRIVVPLGKTKHIYLLDDKKQLIYRVTVKRASDNKLITMANDKDNRRSEVSFEKLGDKYTLFYQTGVRVAQYSYLLNKETMGLFVTRLLSSNNTGSITAKEQNGVTTYSDGNSMRLTIKKKTGAVAFSDYNNGTSRSNYSYANYLSAGLTNLNSIGVSLDDVRYDCYDTKRHLLVYRNYINGYPVIANENAGSYSIVLTNSGGKKIDFSIYTLQIPVPAVGGDISLPATNQVLDSLNANGYSREQIKDIKIGYSWNQNQSTSQVVDLEPTYFVKYNGQWLDYQSLVNN